jgi:hypothetical protein
MRKSLVFASAFAAVALVAFAVARLDAGRARSSVASWFGEPSTSATEATKVVPPSQPRAPGGASSGSVLAATMSPYRTAVAAPTLSVLDEMERRAEQRGQGVLLARIRSERARVLKAVDGLPQRPPGNSERNEP